MQRMGTADLPLLKSEGLAELSPSVATLCRPPAKSCMFAVGTC